MLSSGYNSLWGRDKFDWVQEVGAEQFPDAEFFICVNDIREVRNPLIPMTSTIQLAIDSCSAQGGGTVYFKPGSYLTGALFLKDNVNLRIDEGVELRAAMDIKKYPLINTRVAGIEMKWPAAVINALGVKNAAISGKGTVHAQGKIHWEKYWSLRDEYTPKGIRWAADYDCKRVRTILISNTENFTLKDITLKQSGFWTVHILYSTLVTVDGIIIKNNIDGYGPSTDGIDIDSSSKILVENCDIDCHDDNFCLKSGRDADGLRVNIPTEYVVIRNCLARQGGGLITLGSETSGGISNVWVENLEAHKTKTAIRLKSALTRGGTIENACFKSIKAEGVRTPIVVDLNWNPSYSYTKIPDDIDNVPAYWHVMNTPVSKEDGLPHFKDIIIEDLKCSNAQTAIVAKGLEDSKLECFILRNVYIEAKKAGVIENADQWTWKNVEIVAKTKINVKNSTIEMVD